MKIGLVVLVWFASACALACDVKQVALVNLEFTDVDQALHWVTTKYAYRSARLDVEYVGEVRRHGNVLTVSVFEGCRGSDSFNLTVGNLPSVVAMWHTHGAPGYLREYFSPQDAQLVRKLQRPLYLLQPGTPPRVLSVAEAAKPGSRLNSRRSLYSRAFGYKGRSIHRSIGAMRR